MLLSLALVATPGCGKKRAAVVQPALIDGANAETEIETEIETELEQVCAHSYEVLVVPSGAGSPGVRRDFMTGCVAGGVQMREAIGAAAWSEHAACLLAGATAEAIGECRGQREPEAQAQADGDRVSVSEVCQHILSVMDKEFGGGLIPAAELPEFERSCVKELEKNRSDDPIEFERQARCMLRMSKIEHFQSCEQE